MKKDLKKIRLNINNIDNDMKHLFIKRMELIKQVIEYKKENNLNILDTSRENEIINLNSNDLLNSEYYEYYLEFIKNIMNISKEYQKNILNSSKNNNNE